MLNMDFSRRVVIDTRASEWVASPRPGVWRKPLAREDAERGHATSIVRYDPGASFSGHNHPGGEEILVLEGTFSDETGDFPAGTYFRNPLGFRHAPFSKEGCLILVKLHQFQPDDDARVAIQTRDAAWQQISPGLSKLPLHNFSNENVALLSMKKGASCLPPMGHGGEEIYVVSGAISDDKGSYSAGTWIRQPSSTHSEWHAVQDSMLWLKSGHLGL